MAIAPAAYLLYTRIMRHDPADPTGPTATASCSRPATPRCCSTRCCTWPATTCRSTRSSAFRQRGSHTPGPPRATVDTPGVETTTGPLGQGFGNGVGMAMAERFLRERFGAEVLRPPHLRDLLRRRPDGGRLLRGRLARRPPPARPARLSLRRQPDHDRRPDRARRSRHEDVEARFRAYGWHTLAVEDGNDLDGDRGRDRGGDRRGGAADADPPADGDRLRLPREPGRAAAHGDPLGAGRGARDQGGARLGPGRARSSCPTRCASTSRAARRARARTRRREWHERFDAWADANPALAAEWARAWAGRPSRGSPTALPRFDPAERPTLVDARRPAAQVMQAFAPFVPTMVGGAADLVESTITEFPDGDSFTPRARRRATSTGASASTGWAPRSTASRSTAGSSSRSARRSSSSPTTCARRSGSRR